MLSARRAESDKNMGYIKNLLSDTDYQNFENDMVSMADLELEYTEEELDNLFEKFGIKY